MNRALTDQQIRYIRTLAKRGMSYQAIAEKYHVSTRSVRRYVRGGRTLRRHGTVAAFRRHKRAGQEPCDPCRLKINEYDRERRRNASRAA